MWNTTRRRWWPIAGVVLLAGVVAVILTYLFRAPDRALTGTVVQAVSAVLVPAAALCVWLWRRRLPRAEEADAVEDGSLVRGSVRARHVSGQATVAGVDADEVAGGVSVHGETAVDGVLGGEAKVYGVKVRRLGGPTG